MSNKMNSKCPVCHKILPENSLGCEECYEKWVREHFLKMQAVSSNVLNEDIMNSTCKCERIEGGYIICHKHFKESGILTLNTLDKKFNEIKFKFERKNKKEIEWHLSNLYISQHSFNVIKKYVEDCLKKEKTDE